MATIARNEALRIAARPVPDPLEAAGEPAEESHEDEVVGQADMDRAIAGLSGVDRESSAVATGTTWTTGELGRLLHVPEGTARVRLHRALARLRKALVEA